MTLETNVNWGNVYWEAAKYIVGDFFDESLIERNDRIRRILVEMAEGARKTVWDHLGWDHSQAEPGTSQYVRWADETIPGWREHVKTPSDYPEGLYPDTAEVRESFINVSARKHFDGYYDLDSTEGQADWLGTEVPEIVASSPMYEPRRNYDVDAMGNPHPPGSEGEFRASTYGQVTGTNNSFTGTGDTGDADDAGGGGDADDAVDLTDIFNIPGIEELAGYGGVGNPENAEWGDIPRDTQIRLPSGDLIDLGDIWAAIAGSGTGRDDSIENPDITDYGSEDEPGDGDSTSGDGDSTSGDSTSGDPDITDYGSEDEPGDGNMEWEWDDDQGFWENIFEGGVNELTDWWGSGNAMGDIIAGSTSIIAGYVGAEAGRDAASISAAALTEQGIRQDRLARDIMATGVTYNNEQRDIALAASEPWRTASAYGLAGMMDMTNLPRTNLTASVNTEDGTGEFIGTGGADGTGGGESMYDPEFGYDLNRINDPSDILANAPMYDWKTDPGYEFRLNETIGALENSYNANSGVKSGAYDKALMETAGGFASEEFSNVFNRLQTIAGFGQSFPAEGGTGDQGISAGGNSLIESGNYIGAAGDARAMGQLAGGQSWMDAATSFLGYLGGRR